MAAPPKDGEANEETLRYLAEVLAIRPRQIELVRGHKSREKNVVVRLGPEDARSVADLKRQLEQEIMRKG